MNQKAKADELILCYFEKVEEKLRDPDITLVDIVTVVEKLVNIELTLRGQPIARKEIILKLVGAEGEEVSGEYRVVIEETLAKLIGLREPE